MPVIKVWCLPEIDEPKLNALHKSIVRAVVSVEELGIKDENDMTCLFVPDMMKYGLGSEIVIEVTGLFAKPERTDEVRQRLAERLGQAVKELFWATDFTELAFHGKKVYVSTIVDLFTRELRGLHVGTRKGAPLTVQTLANALFHHPKPMIFHSDNGREYEAKVFIALLEQYGITISRSRPGSPWENGYQESFYGKFKMDLGDPNRCKTLGELVAEIYRTAWEYNHTRIHSALRMPPSVFAEKIAA